MPSRDPGRASLPASHGAIWLGRSGENIRVLIASENRLHPVLGVAFSPDGQVLATASLYAGLALWDAPAGGKPV
jgi:WD40 repeat protein